MTSRPARSAVFASCALASTFLLTLASTAPEVRAETVYGTVVDRNQWPVPSLLVRLIPRVSAAALPADDPRATNVLPVASTDTDIDGRFQFDNVPAGRYMVVAGTIRAGMNTERFTLERGRDQALNLMIADPIQQGGGVVLPPMQRLRPMTVEERQRFEAERMRNIEESLDPARVAARNRAILQSMDDDDDGAGPTVLLGDGNDLGNGAVRRADLARRGILRDESLRDDEGDDDRFGDDDVDVNAGNRLSDGRRVRTRGPGTAVEDQDELVTGRRTSPYDISRGAGGPGNTRDVSRDDDESLDATRDASRADDTLGRGRDVSRAGDDELGGVRDISRAGDEVGGVRDISRAGDDLGGVRDVSRAGDDLGASTRDISRADGSLGGTRDVSRADGTSGGTGDVSRAGNSLGNTQDVSRAGDTPGGVRDVSRAGDELGGTRDISRADDSLTGNTRDITRDDDAAGGTRDVSRDDDSLDGTSDVSRDNGMAASGANDISRSRRAYERERARTRASAAEAERLEADDSDDALRIKRPVTGSSSLRRPLRTPSSTLTNRTRPAQLRSPSSSVNGTRLQRPLPAASSSSSSSSSK